MTEVRNSENKRVCDISADRRKAVIQKGKCQTIITVSKDGTLAFTHRHLPST